MRVPFELGLSVGTDIIAYRRILGSHPSQAHLRRLASRFLHPDELRELDRRFPDWQHVGRDSANQRSRIGIHLAGRWAAKEAAKKAWGATLISFKDLRTETLASGEVQIICQSFNDTTHPSGDRLVGSRVEQVAKLSISHDGDYAVATVIATPLHPDILSTLQVRKAEAAKKVAGIQGQSVSNSKQT